jgi:hypothetical protein
MTGSVNYCKSMIEFMTFHPATPFAFIRELGLYWQSSGVPVSRRIGC